MKEKKLFVLLFTVFAFAMAIPAVAQDKSNEDRARALTDHMKEKLLLSDEQYSKVYNINLSFVNKTSGLRNSGGGRLAKARKLKDADGERDKALKGVLTDEQYKTYKSQKEENREEFKKRLKERRG